MQADEEAALVVETRSMSACGSAAPSSMHPGAPCISAGLPGHPLAQTRDDMSVSNALDSALTEAEMTPDLPTKAANTRPGELVPGVSFCEEVRRRVQKMQQELQAREQTVMSLNMQIKSLQFAHRHDLLLHTSMEEHLI